VKIENYLSPSSPGIVILCKGDSRFPIPLSAALAEVEETAELIHAEVEEIAEPHQHLALTYTVPVHLVLQNLLHQLLDCMRQVMAVDTVAVLLQTQDGQQLAVCATLGLEEEITEGIRIPLGRGFAGRIAASCKLKIVDDLSTVEVVSPILRNKGLQSMLGVPLLIEDQVIGVFHVGTVRPRHFIKDDAQLLQLIADRIGLAIEHLAISRPSIIKGSALVWEKFALT
jgi:GAF domain-containing protein